MVRVKICGITNIDDAQAAVNAGADALGFVFYKKSPRYLSPLKAGKIIETLPPFVARIGVFVNEDQKTVLRVAARAGLDTLQFHGDETPGYCRAFQRRGLKVIKAFRVRDGFDLKRVRAYKADAFLFDAYTKEAYGGTGETFAWAVLKALRSSVPVIVSGGLTSGNVKKAISCLKPYAVDASSGVEKSPGKKDHRKVRIFLGAVRQAC